MSSTTSTTSSHSTVIAKPPPSQARLTHIGTDLVGDDFFGIPFTSTRDVPPPYIDSDAPEYTYINSTKPTGTGEPATLAMYLFKFGFLFPPFWVIGSFIFFSPLRAPPTPANTYGAWEWLPEKTDAERALILHRLRRAELKWARRCLFALLALVHLVIAVVVGVVMWRMLRRA